MQQTHAGCRRALAAVAALSMFSLVGCVINSGSPIEPRPTVSTPTIQPIRYATLVERQNGRVDQLQSLYSRGVIELQWVDEEGEEHHEPQVDLDFWAKLPNRFALRADKFGDVIFWIGADEDSYWIFDLFSKETAVEIGLTDDGSRRSADRGLDAMMHLMGLTRLPDPGDPGTPQVEHDPDRDTWFIRHMDAGIPVRVDFHRATLLPTRVEVLDPDGEAQLTSTLDRYTSVRMPGMSPLLFPRIAEKIWVVDGRGTELKIFLDGADSGEGQPFERVFDLDRLLRAYPTDHVYDRRQQTQVNAPDRPSR